MPAKPRYFAIRRTDRKASTKRSMILVLGMLSATAPMAIDMYLPSIPSMAVVLNADEGALQLTLMTFFAGLMLGQLFYGPLSDKFGRKPLAYLGLSIFALGSIGCALAQTIEQLQWTRLVQGLGGSIGVVTAFSIVRDQYSGADIGKMMSLILAVMGVTPVLAPLAGDFLHKLGSWRTIFWVMTAYAVVLSATIAVVLPETRRRVDRDAYVLARTLNTYFSILTDKRFIPFVAALCTAQAGFFAYLAGSASVYISEHGLSPTQFSLLFGFNAVGLISASLFNPLVHRRIGPLATYRYSSMGYSLTLAILVSYLALGGTSTWVLAAGLFMVVGLMGFLMPSGGQLALLQQGRYAGTASALMGSMQFAGAALISGVSGALAHLGGLGLTTIMLVCALGSTLICLVWFPKKLNVKM